MKSLTKEDTPQWVEESESGHHRETELQRRLNEALFIGKFMGAINASLDTNDVCAIAARVLYEHIPYHRIVFFLSPELNGSTLTFSPAQTEQSGGNPADADPVCNFDAGDPAPSCNDNARFRRYSFELPEEMGSIEVLFHKRAVSRFSVQFLTSIAENFACVLRNSLEYGKVKELAMRDSLTGLFNRRVFDEMLGLEGERQKLMPLSMLLIDLDDFKQVNDTFGHTAGDHVLATFGRILRESFRGADLVARYGGEEVAVILTTTPASKAGEIAQRLRTRLDSTTFAFDGRHFKLTASIGIACTFDTATTPICNLIQQADNALYRAKMEGKDRAVIYPAEKIDSAGKIETEKKKTGPWRQTGEMVCAMMLPL